MSGPAFQVPDLPADRPKVPDVAPIVQALYRRHPCGCCWHAVLDDGNHNSVSWCVAYIASNGGCQDSDHPGATECLELAALLPRMTKTQLRKLARSKR